VSLEHVILVFLILTRIFNLACAFLKIHEKIIYFNNTCQFNRLG
jgi:hypothetical protein